MKLLDLLIFIDTVILLPVVSVISREHSLALQCREKSYCADGLQFDC